MSDRLKFRVWLEEEYGHKDDYEGMYAPRGYLGWHSKEVVERLWYHLMPCGKEVSWGYEDAVHEPLIISERVIVEMCTGLKDCNGKLIYEGDIIKGSNGSINGVLWPWGPMAIRYKDGGFNVPLWGTEENKDRTHWFEVIGNIHENAELIEPNKS